MAKHVLSRRTDAALCALVLITGLLGAPTSGAATVDGGWTITQSGDAGLNATTLNGARDYAFASGRNTQGVVVVRGGRIASEWYAPGEGPRSWAASWSEGKSIASILIGIAIDEGKIAGVDEPMTTWFPDWVGTPKAAITLRNVLNMESGLQSDENYDPTAAASSTVIKLGLSADQLSFARNRPLVNPPGTIFNYSSADAMLLSHVISVATGMSAGEFAQKKLFDPLGIHQVEWWKDTKGNTLTYCCVDTTSRNFARIGQLYLNDGNWNGHQIVSASWVHDSLTPTAASDGHYGYMWWITQMPGVQGPVYMMNGFDGQFTYVIPSLDMVVVRNGDYVKSACDPIADPNLFAKYPPTNLVPGAGTRPPDTWDHAAFLQPIVDAVTGPGPTEVFAGPEAKPATRDPDGQAMVACPATTPTKVTPAGPSAPVARAVAKEPTFTG